MCDNICDDAVMYYNTINIFAKHKTFPICSCLVTIYSNDVTFTPMMLLLTPDH